MQTDADIWRHILCCKSFSKASSQLCQSIADTTKRLCTEDIDSTYTTELFACRLIPLRKGTDGVRPIGVGEVVRRIMAKAVGKVYTKN